MRALTAAALLIPLVAQAGGIPLVELEPVTVTGTAANKLADDAPISASQGLVEGAQLQERPLSRPGEVLEFVPGLMVTQHSGEGKANQYFLRGFNLDHGTDFFTQVDGVPVNMPSHGHGQGYADANFVMPELLGSLEYRKGPYYAEVSDFGAAGSADLRYQNRLDHAQTRYSLSEYGSHQLLMAGSPTWGSGDWLLGTSLGVSDGPFARNAQERRMSAIARYHRGIAKKGHTVSLQGYSNRWFATDQIPERAILSGDIGRYGFVDGSDGGNTHRVSLSGEWRGEQADGRSHWSVSGYALDYRLRLFSNFTYFLDDPIRGDQFEQFDRRQVYGGSARKHWRLPTRIAADFEVGGNLRYDHIGTVGLYRTQTRNRTATVREDGIDQFAWGLFASSQQRWQPWLRSQVGLRVDGQQALVDSRSLADNSGQAAGVLASPKLSLEFGPWANTRGFINMGYGHHSNDARGTTIRVDPNDPSTAQNPVSPLVRAKGVDLGLTSRVGDKLKLAASLFALNLDSELVYVGDAGVTEARGKSNRRGLELSAYYQPIHAVTVDVDYARTHARLDSEAGDRIPNALEDVFSLGVTMAEYRGWSGGLRLRTLGPAPLNEDNSARSNRTTVLNAQVGYRPHPRYLVQLGLLNALNSRDDDIRYFYTSRLQGEPAEGVDDAHLHPVTPRTLRLSLQAEW